MSKDLRNNERYLKKKADKYNPLPPPMVWDEIEHGLDKDKRKKRPFPILWISFGVLVIGALMFNYIRVKNDKELPKIEHELIINDSQKQTDANPQDIGSVDSEATTEVTNGQNASSSETTPIVSDNHVENKANSETLESVVTRQQQFSNLKTSNVDMSLNANTINANSINTNVAPRVTQKNIFRQSMSTQSTTNDMKSLEVTPLQKLEWLGRTFASSLALPDPSENLTAILTSEFKGNPISSSPWFVELGGGIGKNLSNPKVANPTQGGYRLNTESSWYTWSTSLQLGYQFDNLWYTTIGFDLNQTKQKFDYWRRDINSLIVGENQSSKITNIDFYNIGEIRYTFADIGLSLGRRVNIDKWHFSIEGGPIFNLQFNANGKVQVGVFEFSRLEDQEEYFNTQIGIGARLSAMLDYPISDQLWISIGPSYHQYFKTISSDENPLQERNSILQLRAKMRYNF